MFSGKFILLWKLSVKEDTVHEVFPNRPCVALESSYLVGHPQGASNVPITWCREG